MKHFTLIFKLTLLLSVAGVAQTNSTGQDAAAIAQHHQRASQLAAHNQPELAIQEYRKILAMDPDDHEAITNVGVLLYFGHDYPEAIPFLQRAITQDPSLFKIEALLGLSEQITGKPDAAERDLSTALPHLSDAPFHLQAGLVLAELQSAQTNWVEAQHTLAVLLQSNPDDPRVLYAVYRTASDQATEALLNLTLKAPQSGQLRLAIAHELFRIGDKAAALRNLEDAVRLDPNLPGVHYELAQALSQADDSPHRLRAEAEFKLALDQNPSDAASAVALGNLCLARNELSEANLYLQRALTSDPASADAAIALSQLDVQNGDLISAARKLDDALSRNPQNATLHYERARLYRKQGDTERANEEIKIYKQLNQLKQDMDSSYQSIRNPADAPAK